MQSRLCEPWTPVSLLTAQHGRLFLQSGHCLHGCREVAVQVATADPEERSRNQQSLIRQLPGCEFFQTIFPGGPAQASPPQLVHSLCFKTQMQGGTFLHLNLDQWPWSCSSPPEGREGSRR